MFLVLGNSRTFWASEITGMVHLSKENPGPVYYDSESPYLSDEIKVAVEKGIKAKAIALFETEGEGKLYMKARDPLSKKQKALNSRAYRLLCMREDSLVSFIKKMRPKDIQDDLFKTLIDMEKTQANRVRVLSAIQDKDAQIEEQMKDGIDPANVDELYDSQIKKSEKNGNFDIVVDM